MQALIAVLAAVAGILVGYWLRQLSAKNEKLATEGEKVQLTQRAAELSGEIVQVRSDLTQVQSIAASRAGFESLCAERQVTIDRLTTERDQTRTDLQGKTDAESRGAARISQLEAELRNERQNLAEKLALLETAKQTLANQFQALAGDILDQKSKSFAEASQKDLGNLLTPLQSQIKEFREKVEQAQSDSKTGVTKLETLIGTLGDLNKALSEEAHNLATALRADTKAQGNWGEQILRNILEKSGLQEGLHYTFQQSFVELNEEGLSGQRRQTDVVVQIPGGRNLIIDSKVSLNAYNDFVNADNDKARADALKRHLASIRSHYTDLSSRNYQHLTGMVSPDFVVMFVPIEPAFLIALQNDEGVWLDAYQKRVLLCGPTTVLFVIQIVVDLWRQEQQARNVKDVMRRGELLYDKFVGFVSDLEKIGKSLQSARDCYDTAMDKLKKGGGSLIGQAEKLKKLGVKSAKSLPKSFLEAAGEEEEPLALAAEADETVAAE